MLVGESSLHLTAQQEVSSATLWSVSPSVSVGALQFPAEFPPFLTETPADCVSFHSDRFSTRRTEPCNP